MQVEVTTPRSERDPALRTLKIKLEEGSKVRDIFKRLKIDEQLVMLVVVDGKLSDPDTVLHEGSKVKLIPPISGG